MWEKNCFITLTYDDEHLPEDWSLRVRDWQLFAKSVRRKVGKFRFLHVGEYGDENHRPHYHAVIFGLDFSEDRKFHAVRRGNTVYRSDLLEECWTKGFSEVTSFSYETAAYVARYCMKKRDGDQAVHLHGPRKPEYITMSRNPGLGATWIEKFSGDVFPGDFCVVDGRKTPVPKYYDKWLEENDPELLEQIKDARVEAGREHTDNNTYERLEVRETCLRAKIQALQRTL